MTVRQLCVLGASGTIGLNTLDVVRKHPDKVSVFALTANSDTETMARLCAEFRPRYAAMADDSAARLLTKEVGDLDTEVLSGVKAISELAAHADCTDVMSAIVGAAGLEPTLAAINAGKRTLVANKEPLVMAGKLVMQSARRSGAKIIPVDSEHNAIFQCLPSSYVCGSAPVSVRKIVLTASGGPFRDWPIHEIANATVEQALQHPNWVMGRKITIDSATMMNKGLELIEAHWLFSLPQDHIDVLLHPQSVIHSMVHFSDGSSLAQLGEADMRVPIANALGWPERWSSGVSSVDLMNVGTLTFRQLELDRYPAMALARKALTTGCWSSNVLNAANEVSVDAFLQQKISFGEIHRINAEVMDSAAGHSLTSIELDALAPVLEVDQWARNAARIKVAESGKRTVYA